LAACDFTASRHVERGRPGERSAGGAPRLLSRGAARAEAAHRLDRALSRLLDGPRRAPIALAGGHGRMNAVDTTARGQTETITFEFDLQHPPEKVWRALTDPRLLAQWLLPVL